MQSIKNKLSRQPKLITMHETRISTVQKPGKILARKEQKHVGSVTSWDRGRNIKVVCIVWNIHASHIYIPMQTTISSLRKGGLAGAIYRYCHNDWSNEELFKDWLQHFKDNTKRSEEDPVWLITDNHISHINLKSFNFCKAKRINVVSIPPHTSHRLQRLDLSAYRPLKRHLTTSVTVSQE